MKRYNMEIKTDEWGLSHIVAVENPYGKYLLAEDAFPQMQNYVYSRRRANWIHKMDLSADERKEMNYPIESHYEDNVYGDMG